MNIRQLRVQGLPDLAEDDYKLVRKLDRLAGAATTVQSVLDLDPERFGLAKGVGAGYVSRLQGLQEKLRSLFPELESAQAPPLLDRSAFEDASLAEYTLNETGFTRAERKFLVRLRETAGTATLDRIVSIDAAEYAKQTGVGETKSGVVRSLQARVIRALRSREEAPRSPEMKRSPIVHNAHQVLDASKIERILIEDFEEYLHHLDEMLSTIALARWGYHQPRRTLKELGKELGMTRERVRQLEVEASLSLPWCLRLHPDVLWSNLRRLGGRDLSFVFPLLRESFAKPETLHEFLEACSLRPIADNPERLWLAPEQEIGLAVLEEFLATTPAPLGAEEFESELRGGQGMGPHQARAFVDRLTEAGHLVPTEHGLEPRDLKRTVAVAHVLAGEPAGLPFGDIARCANVRQLTERPFREDRLSSGIGGNPWIHLYGKGTYRHNNYLELSQEQVMGALAMTRTHLQAKNTRSRNLQMLYSGVFRSSCG